MFTGIISACTKIIDIQANKGNKIFQIEKPTGWDLAKGESISVDGVCSTVVAHDNEKFEVVYMPKTLEVTTLNNKEKNVKVNLERSLQMQDLVSGHLVYGHVDTVGKIVEIQGLEDSHLIAIQTDAEKMKYVVHKGSITINGVSMTVIDPKQDSFQVSVIPHTWQHTNLNLLKPDDEVNIEYDMIAKYIEQLANKDGR